MKSDATVNPDPLQPLLASAFIVQETGMSRDWFADFVRLRRSIAERDLSLGEAMQRVATQTGRVAHADGTAIALWTAGELAYEACIGTAGISIGQRVTAALHPSTPHRADVAILRVEDADTDLRIQAEICRQFEAQALLILPFYSGSLLAGVLQISFERPHQFSDSELQVYWMLAWLAGQATSLSSKPKASMTVATSPAKGIQVLEAGRAAVGNQFDRAESPGGFGQPAVLALNRSPLKEASTIPAIREAEGARAPWMRTMIPRLMRVWDTGVAAVVVIAVLVLALYRDGGTTSLPTDGATSDGFHSEPVGLVAPIAKASEPPPSSTPMRTSVPRSRAPSAKRLCCLATPVEHFGDDVTVRHFLPKSAVMQHSDEPNTRHLPDDVTVRHFEPRNVQTH